MAVAKCMVAILETHHEARYRVAESAGIARKPALHCAADRSRDVSTSAIFHMPNQRRMAVCGRLKKELRSALRTPLVINKWPGWAT